MSRFAASHTSPIIIYFVVNSTVNCTYGDIRLVNGSTQYEGRVEVCLSDGSWHSICHDNWGGTDANVVCKQLGYAYTGCKNEV